MSAHLLDYAAIILAGGRAARLDGVDKASIELHGRTLLAHALEAVIDASEVVVVGDQVVTDRPVTFVRESPTYGGPVAALLTGVDSLARRPTRIAVTAVDMPHLSTSTMRRLSVAVHDDDTADGAVLTDPDGRRQLALLMRADSLARVRPGHEEQHGMPLHVLLADLRMLDVPAVGDEHRDVDTWSDLRALGE